MTNKTSNISRTPTFDESEQIILTTDDNIEITSIGAEKINSDSEIIEFSNDHETETYAKIGVIDDKHGLFVNNLYDLNGNPYPVFAIDSSNNILIISGKKYKMIPYIEEN